MQWMQRGGVWRLSFPAPASEAAESRSSSVLVRAEPMAGHRESRVRSDCFYLPIWIGSQRSCLSPDDRIAVSARLSPLQRPSPAEQELRGDSHAVDSA